MVLGAEMRDVQRHHHHGDEEVVREKTTVMMGRRGDKVLRTVRQSVIRKYQRSAVRQAEYRRLKAIVPSVADKKSVSKLTVIEEAIRYIDRLHDMLDDRLQLSHVQQSPHHRGTSSDSLRPDVPPVCHQHDHSFLRLLFPVPAVAGSDVTPAPPASGSHHQTALSCSSRISKLRL